MEPNYLHLNNLRNDEHFQFFTDFIGLVNSTGAAKLKIEVPFNILLPFHDEEDEALKKIMKSDFTRKIHEADRERDTVFRGMAEANLTALNHFKPAVREAAIRLQIVFDTYGNVAQKPADEETSAIYNLLKELMHNHEADLELVGLNPWAEELHTRNRAFEKLTMDRDGETAGRTSLVLRRVRIKVDDTYSVIIKRLDALQTIEGEAEGAPYADFITKLNATIERYESKLAQRRGHAAKKKEEQQKPTKPAEPPTNGE